MIPFLQAVIVESMIYGLRTVHALLVAESEEPSQVPTPLPVSSENTLDPSDLTVETNNLRISTGDGTGPRDNDDDEPADAEAEIKSSTLSLLAGKQNSMLGGVGSSFMTPKDMNELTTQTTKIQAGMSAIHEEHLETRKQVRDLSGQLAVSQNQLKELMDVLRSGQGHTDRKIGVLEIDLQGRVGKVENHLGTMKDQVRGALERTQELLATYKADDVRAQISRMEDVRQEHSTKVEEELHYLRVQMQSVESYSSWDKSTAQPAGSSIRNTGARLEDTTMKTQMPVLNVPGEYKTIQAAIDAVKEPGSKIRVCPGIYRENLKIKDKHLEIVGLGGREGVVIEGGGNRNVVYFSKSGADDDDDDDENWDDEEEEESGDSKLEDRCTGRIVGVTIHHIGHVDDRYHYGAICVNAGSFIIQDCSLNSLGGAGVYIQGKGTTARLVDCSMRCCLQSGLLASNQSRVVIEKCQLSENYCDGLCVQKGATAQISRSRLNCNDRGLHIIGEGSSARIEFNEILGNERDALHIDPACRTKVVSRCNSTEIQELGNRDQNDKVNERFGGPRRP